VILLGAMAAAGALSNAAGERGLFVIAAAVTLAGGGLGAWVIPRPAAKPDAEIAVDR
jgi:hypothetical protein